MYNTVYVIVVAQQKSYSMISRFYMLKFFIGVCDLVEFGGKRIVEKAVIVSFLVCFRR